MDAISSTLRYDDGDVDTNNTDNDHLNDLVATRYSRRETLSGLGAASAAFLGSGLLAACGSDDNAGGGDSLPATVTAGADISTRSGRVVNLTGAVGSGPVQAIGFEQVSGPAVTLTNAASLNASFIAPSVDVATPLVFRFTGRDLAGALVTDEITVTVDQIALGFTAVARNLNDVVTVPADYTVQVLYRGGDPIKAGVAAFRNDGTDTDWGSRAGDHHDGMYYYGLNSTGTARQSNNSERGLLVMNHENINDTYMHVGLPTNSPAGPRPASEAIKEIEAHGVSIVEISRNPNLGFTINQASPFNRRITPNTPVEIAGPVRGHPLMRTKFSPNGTRGRGTVNNCAFGFFTWGMYQTDEENWAGYFRRPTTDNVNRSPREQVSLRRYGVSSSTGNYGWSTAVATDPNDDTFRRWDARVDTTQPADGTGDYRNEPYQFGWVVDIDPYDVNSVPKKRTALGRFAHEGSWHGSFRAGQKFAVYLGDDSRGEYFYKFVSDAVFDPADNARNDRMAVSDKYFDAGILYVAKFNSDGTGSWTPLVFGQVPNRAAQGTDVEYVFENQADILINARLAADAVGATRMDRPEWTATDNKTGEIYLTLTNNNATLRPLAGTDAANPRHYNDPRGAANNFGNPNGHILRLRENGDNNAATSFIWDIYLFAAGSDLNAQNINLSGLTPENDFSSPDGAWFSRPTNASGSGARQLLWIQTDDGAFTDVTHNQMLAAIPGSTRDGGPRSITNTGSNGATAQQTTFVGAPATSPTLRRFMVGPRECELTGVDSTPDGRSLFVNIQHPGENGNGANITSNWPQSQTGQASGRPRSATVVVYRNDGGVVGL